MSHEALCILTGLTPIIIKLGEIVSAYRVARGCDGANILMDTVIPFKDWPHPADTVLINSRHESKVDVYKRQGHMRNVI